jgi:hypothetical protein
MDSPEVTNAVYKRAFLSHLVARKIAQLLILIVEKFGFLGDVAAVSFVDGVVGDLVLGATVRHYFAFRTPQEFLGATAETTAMAVRRCTSLRHHETADEMK